MKPEDVAKIFMEYYRKGAVSGLFISSGVQANADDAMDRIIQAAQILRKKERFKGYIHLKVIPGSSDGAIERAVSLASAVSINIEAPGEGNFAAICKSKHYEKDIIRPLKLISRLTARGNARANVKKTTQFVVGASHENDYELVRYSAALYNKLGINRIYFSAYQRGVGAEDLPGETAPYSNEQLLIREHRLYQTDWLLRKYGFSHNEIPFDQHGRLHLDIDPKQAWAESHPEFYPVRLNSASRRDLLRVPGFGEITVKRIINRRKNRPIQSLRELEALVRVQRKAMDYVVI